MTSCVGPSVGLTDDEALVVAEPYFRELQRVFKRAGLRRVEKARLIIDPSMHDADRHFAGASTDGREVRIAPVIASLPEDNLVAILAHELGHIADYAYPCRFQLVDGGLIEWDHPDWKRGAEDVDPDAARSPAEARKARTAHARRLQWESRESDVVERTADAVAEMATGRAVYYAGPCDLQSFAGGVRPRPPGLR